jgi:anti-sigma factor RsiW
MSEHTDVGAYSLGLLEQQDRQAFEAHLADCPVCTAELAELSGMAGLLTGVEPVGPAETAAEAGDNVAVTDLLRRRAAAQAGQSARWASKACRSCCSSRPSE